MNRQQQVSLAGGFGLGAGLMYLLDPQGGARRRSLARDKAVHALHAGSTALGKASRDLAHRSKGLVMRAGSRLHHDGADDQVLHDRVRSKLGRSVSHPAAIEVTAEGGRIILTGDVLAEEVDRLLTAVRAVPGVHEVENRLQVHNEPGDVPSLQGGAVRRSWSRRSLPPATRLLLVAGGALCAAGAAVGTARLGLLGRDSKRGWDGDMLLAMDEEVEAVAVCDLYLS